MKFKQMMDNEDCANTWLWKMDTDISVLWIDITPDLKFLNIHNPFTNERISIYLDKHNHMSLDKKDYFVEQISHLSKGVVIVASALCQLNGL